MKAAIAMEVDEQVPNGSIVHWSEKKGQIVPVTCGLCETRRPLKVKSVNQLKRFGTFTGYHNHCRILKHNKDLAKDGVDPHPSGAVIYWRWEDRDPEDPTHRVGMLCSNKDRCVTPGQKSFINRHVVESVPNWSGRCSACVERDGLPQRRKDPGEDEILKPGQSVAHWSEYSNGSVPVTCGYPLGGVLCGNKRLVLARSIHTERRRGHIYTGYCKKHHYEEIRALRAMKLNGQQSGVLMSSDAQKKPQAPSTGRPPLNKKEEYQKAVDAVLSVWNEVRTINLPFDDLLPLVTQIKVAAALGLGEKGSENSGDQLRGRLRTWEVHKQFPGEKKWFPAWVKAIVTEFEKEMDNRKKVA